MLRKCLKPNSPPWGVVTWIWSVCKCVCLILWGFRHFAICFCYDWIAKGDGKMGAPSRRESSVYIFVYIYIYIYTCMRVCVRLEICVYVQTRTCTCMCVSIYKWVLFLFVFVVRLASQLGCVVQCSVAHIVKMASVVFLTWWLLTQWRFWIERDVIRLL